MIRSELHLSSLRALRSLRERFWGKLFVMGICDNSTLIVSRIPSNFADEKYDRLGLYF